MKKLILALLAIVTSASFAVAQQGPGESSGLRFKQNGKLVGTCSTADLTSGFVKRTGDTCEINTGRVFDVRSTAFAGGANPADSNDDNAAVQAAWDACIAAGGGYVYLPGSSGTYLLSNFLLKAADRCTLIGDGPATKVAPFGTINYLTKARQMRLQRTFQFKICSLSQVHFLRSICQV
jgi:hypothetical protein